MNVELEDSGPSEKRLTITVEAAAVTRALDRAYGELRKEAKLPGFRRGRAPRKVLEEQFGAEMGSEVAERLVGEALPKALAEQEIVPAGAPEIDKLKRPRRGQPFRFSVVIQLKPDIELPSLDGLETPPPPPPSTEEEVDEQLASMRTQNQSLLPADVGSMEDGLVADITLTLQAEAAAAPHTAEHLLVGMPDDDSKEFVRELVTNLHRGEKAEGEVDVPPDYADDGSAGRRCQATVELHEIFRRVLPPLDDDFASAMGHESMEGLRAAVLGALDQVKKQRSQAQAERQILEQIFTRSTFEVPPKMVEQRAETLVVAIANELMPDMEGASKTTLDDLEPDKKADVMREAEFSAGRELILEAVARQQGLTVTDEEREKRIATIGSQTGQPAEVVTGYFEAPGRLASLTARIVEEKAMAWLLEQAVVKAEE